MGKVLLFSLLLMLGLAGSQVLPGLVGAAYGSVAAVVRLLTMAGLSFIMIRVGYGFDIDKSHLRRYGWDYFVAATAAAFPWVFVSLYFVFVLLPSEVWGSWEAWEEVLLAGRFASPTSAGVLFAMLAAAGLGGTWLYNKARVLAVFDDLDTVLFLIPLQMFMVGLSWELGGVVFVLAGLLVVGFVGMRRLHWPVTWPWLLLYAVCITLLCHAAPVHIEVLLPAFVLGSMLAYPEHAAHTRAGMLVVNGVVAAFMVLVGLSMPFVLKGSEALVAGAMPVARIVTSVPALGWQWLALHVLAVTALANLGKMFVVLCYRREASLRERLALGIGMWPRGEVGGGVLVVSMSYGIDGPVVTVAMLSLVLNLMLTGIFIVAVKKVLGNAERAQGA